jgi:intracellular septation protein A
MAYLIIPFICYLVLAGLSWLWFYGAAGSKSWKGTIEEMDRILSNLLTAESIESCLIMRIPENQPPLKLNFHQSLIRLEFQLETDLQQDQREIFLQILRDLKLDTRSQNHKRGHNTLVCDVRGPFAEALPIIKEVFARIFETDIRTLLVFQVMGPFSDREAIDQAVEDYRSKNYPKERKEPTEKQRRAGCMGALTSLLFLPIPFVIGYIEYGFVVASAVLVAIFVLREIYNRWKKLRTGFYVGDVFKIITLLLAGATIWVEDALYLQLIPTIVFLAAALSHFLTMTFNLHWSALVDDPEEFADPSVWKMLSYALITTCVGAAALNEYLRVVLPLDTWIWYFAFVRIELVFGLIATLIPYVFLFSWKNESTDTENN